MQPEGLETDIVPPKEIQQHQKMMQRCLALAQQAAGRTAPNPLVGCVIVRDGEIVGEGFHPQAGEPHAEVFALRAAGKQATGATAYVSLEPCNHFGRTPPCTEALINAQVARVVVGMVDPDPRVSGRGIERLRSANIRVIVGVEEQACQDVNEAFIHRTLHQRPFGTLKYAMTLDGKIATSQGHSAWVTQEAARTHVHQLRSTCDAVIVGGNTVRHDNPRLTSHVGGNSPNPLRVVMTRSLQLPKTAHLWDQEEAATLVLTEGNPNPQFQTELIEQGVEVVNLESLTPLHAMNYLNQRDILSVLWECGGTLAAPAIADGVVQKVLAFVAPKIVGGLSAPSPVGELNLNKMTSAITLERVHWRTLGPDLLVEGYLSSD
ncbi:bifunctional diaminohydroxyphosphoribosylaminopyrimidine deaminase/5-amino-6-(5-phosphoribosylamino)uracil reductase RibD [Acaryochloris thomasi]|uniref:bifunctional diaminohydroxyphosphoribosylaminopyrimidine deaminase/5-amino-6-(5-phosphoribosylamino)uracil reductase RibD n=1 Tax=Acaryochloris thomasi TaxID=2929456 RepID=UPI00387EC8BC